MALRGVDTLLMACEHDPGIDYVDEHYGEEMRALASVPGYRREDVKGADHHFTSLWAQDYVVGTIVEHLKRS
jgi:hypothetical protein